ncbi:hypothetical protein [Bradyrhizobium glycinis]|uniref:hypothetical protein n=1 Tax=Bradyrhizobium glycinis TaxID=2751812 RepID=UPI0018D8E550|nr:hypothetical protein [Bradyrhizobium glycinis]MBH5371124.1 hypothetical protein [Bradyrhizobium glycinis]
MSEEISEVEWNGNALVGWVTINGAPIKVVLDRNTIHRHAPGFDDALTWEIKRHGAAIVERMMPFLRATYG